MSWYNFKYLLRPVLTLKECLQSGWNTLSKSEVTGECLPYPMQPWLATVFMLKPIPFPSKWGMNWRKATNKDWPMHNSCSYLCTGVKGGSSPEGEAKVQEQSKTGSRSGWAKGGDLEGISSIAAHIVLYFFVIEKIEFETCHLCSEPDYHATEPLTSQSESRRTNTVHLRIWSKKSKGPLIPSSSLTIV